MTDMERYTRQIAEELKTCACGRKLNFQATPYQANEKRVCLCGEIHNVDERPVEWEKVKRRK